MSTKTETDAAVSVKGENTIVDISIVIPALAHNTNCKVMEDWFVAQSDFSALPIIKNNKPIGIVSRVVFQERYLSRYGRELYSKKNVSTLMNKHPFVVDYRESITDVSNLLIKENPQALEEGVLVTVDGDYHSYVSGLALMKTTVDQIKLAHTQLASAQQMLLQNEKMAYLGSLVAGVAHEINTPIGVALTAATAFEEKTKDFVKNIESGAIKKSTIRKYTEAANQSVGFLVSNIDRASKLIQSFKQVAVDQSSNQIREFNLCEYCDEVLLSLYPKFKKTPYKIKTKCQDGLLIKSSASAISQILTNLVMNAVNHAFTEDEPGNIKIKMKKVSETMVKLEVSDDGKGIEKETLKQIFNPFFTTKRNSGGTGLGLHIVYNLVTHALKGNIEADSTPGHGTTFSVVFPMQINESNNIRDAFSHSSHNKRSAVN